MADFVLEIGSEELPARFLPGEESYLANAFAQALSEQGLSYGTISTMSTPRRAIVQILGLAPFQAEKDEEVLGPPAKVAYKDGQPTKALEGFCRTNGVAVEEAYLVTSPKGEYVAVKKHTGGKEAAVILAEICPHIIAQIPFAKRMRWGSNDFAYARPLHWIVALLDDQVVPFSVGNVNSGAETEGHRIHGRGPFVVPYAAALVPTLEEQGGIMPDSAKRKDVIIAGGNEQAAKIGGRVLWNDALLQEVVGLVEHPVPLLADFDPCYLEVPREVLITSMQSHQKSFGVEDANGKLLPHFVTVLNITPEDLNLVKHGWERVLRARLEDARFFWHEDLKQSFAAWLEKLESVIFIRGLGSMGDKSRRLESLCAWLAEQCDARLVADCARAGRLAKADLVSGLVGEFDTLQGVMGGIYAGQWAESPVVAQALGEQYLPAGPDSPLPASLAGALLSVADKADTLAGCFGLGMIPTGAADPNGLRRCALGIIRILRDFGLGIDIRELLAKAQAGYGEKEWKIAPSECLDKLMDFMAGRLRNYYQNLGVNTLLVDAALGADNRDIRGVDGRLEALQGFSQAEDYALSVQTFKRVANIVAKQVSLGVEIPAVWRKSLLQEDAEKALDSVLEEVLPRLDQLWANRDYAGMLMMLSTLRPSVDAFFAGVMVSCEDKQLSGNRLAMLRSLSSRFAKIADFAALQV